MFLKFINLNTFIGNSEKTFIIAEVGQNHQGDIKLAKKLIKTAKECGADCVKFQKTCPEEKFNKLALTRPYISPNSFGPTYGDHKAYLEFNENEFLDLQKYADDLGIFFTASAMDAKSLDLLIECKVPFIKIGSGDSNNSLLIEKAAKTGIPLIISTGMLELDAVKTIYNLVSKYHKKFVLLHCVSAYPAPFEDINLSVVTLFKREFPDITIGYSGHELGTHISTAAVALGCKVIERHITLDKTQKGSDHCCSLEPDEFKMLVDNIRNVEKAMGQPVKVMQNSELPCYEKLGKTLVYTKDLCKGHILSINDLNIKVAEPKGINGTKLNDVLGKTLTVDVEEDGSVLEEHLDSII
ncbi:hypothetical protein NQ314_007362 [Rhamnusium bicolor]|uniref:AFP-like domain-containing protein n=1 Tax=Rhamnusium bicolor TaxID=1586634 RepID=A0AAV8YN35_9CUCU|nr:hypothetical protein NQ314_007362 [Rhamnusium bicolor]